MTANNERLKSDVMDSRSTIQLSTKEIEKLHRKATNMMNELRESLTSSDAPLEDTDYELLLKSIKTTLETMTIKNKEKYTRKKFKRNNT
jgi:hypoxanthine phosphoribosyltransferase